MKLYELKPTTVVELRAEDHFDIDTPVGSVPLLNGDIVTFSHVEGHYSVCYLDGRMVHPAADTRCIIVEVED